MDRYATLLIATLLALTVGWTPAESKVCKCEQHKAEAGGSGSCSRSEDYSYCTISFRGRANEQQMMVLEEFGVQVSEYSPFEVLDRIPPWEMDQQTLLNSIAVAAVMSLPIGEGSAMPLDYAVRFLNAIIQQDFSGSIEPTREGQDMLQDFFRDGCFDYDGGDFRLLVISQFSEFDGNCR